MKNLKKLASLLLVLVMVFALAAPAMAANVTINIDGEDPNNETYTVYKIFDATVNGETTGSNREDETPTGEVSSFENVSYTIAVNSPFYGTIEGYQEEGKPIFSLKPIQGDTSKETVTLADGVETYSAAKLAEALLKVADKDNAIVKDLKNVTAPFEVDSNGYYMITSSLGSMAVVDTIGQNDMTIKTKNTLPTLTKKITEVTNGQLIDEVLDEGADKATVSYGSVVTYTITVDIPASAVGEIKVHDKMDGTLTYGRMTPVAGITENRTDLTDDCTQEYTLAAEYVAEHLGEAVTIVYTATVNDGVEAATALKNSAFLTYSNYTSTSDEVEVTTYEFDLVKTTSKATGNKLLNGASFQLYDDETGGAAYNFKLMPDGSYHFVPEAEAGVTTDTIAVTDGIVRIKGLAANTYYLEETVAPDGYNRLDSRFEFTLNGKLEADTTDPDPAVEGDLGAWTAGGVRVENLTGLELPSTGGIGTTLFYIVGGLLIVGAAVLLITKKRVSGEQ